MHFSSVHPVSFPSSRAIELIAVCRQAWQSLGDMSQQTAMLEFVTLLTRLSSLMKLYVQAFRMEREETERRLYVARLLLRNVKV